MIIVNPGSVAVEGQGREVADANMTAFCKDVGATRFRHIKDLEDGRSEYRLYLDNPARKRPKSVLVEMPQLPLEQVRYQKGMNPWDFPRLYVDGSSWLWCFAVSSARRALGPWEE